jgi:lipopolysaccharide export system protein LptC
MEVLDSVILAPAPPPAALRIVGQPWHLRLLGTITAYLPVLLMLLLALGTWWLVKSTPMPEGERAAAPPRHEADYTMSRFTVQRFARDGAMRVQIEGSNLRHYPDTDTLEVDDARIRAIGVTGGVTLATATRALANGDGSEVQLLGHAKVVREGSGRGDPIEFSGEFLHAFLNTEQVRSHLPVTVRRGASELRAEGMEYDNLTQVVTFKGRTRGSFAPRGAPKALAP